MYKIIDKTKVEYNAANKTLQIFDDTLIEADLDNLLKANSPIYMPIPAGFTGGDTSELNLVFGDYAEGESWSKGKPDGFATGWTKVQTTASDSYWLITTSEIGIFAATPDTDDFILLPEIFLDYIKQQSSAGSLKRVVWLRIYANGKSYYISVANIFTDLMSKTDAEIQALKTIELTKWTRTDDIHLYSRGWRYDNIYTKGLMFNEKFEKKIQSVKNEDLNGEEGRYLVIDQYIDANNWDVDPNQPIINEDTLPVLHYDLPDSLQKPELRIAMYDYDAKVMKKIGEISKYKSYTYKLNHNATSTGEIKFDPNEPQVKALTNLLESADFDPKLEDIFVYNLHDDKEFFKIMKVEFELKDNERSLVISGTNTFFMEDRVFIPKDDADKQKYTDKTIGYIGLNVIYQTGIVPNGEDALAALRQYPYLRYNLGQETEMQKMTLEQGQSRVISIIDKLFKGTLNGYRIELDVEKSLITFKPVLPVSKTDIHVSQEFQNSNGYKVILDGSKKVDAMIARNSSTTYTNIDGAAKSGGRFKESTTTIKKGTSDEALTSQLNQALIKKSDYKTTDIKLIALNGSLLDEVTLGSIVSVDIDDVVKFTKEVQIKQFLKISSDNEYKITPIADDTADTGIELLAEAIRETSDVQREDNAEDSSSPGIQG